jgi:hypothetical protein
MRESCVRMLYKESVHAVLRPPCQTQAMVCTLQAPGASLTWILCSMLAHHHPHNRQLADVSGRACPPLCRTP